MPPPPRARSEALGERIQGATRLSRRVPARSRDVCAGSFVIEGGSRGSRCPSVLSPSFAARLRAVGALVNGLVGQDTSRRLTARDGLAPSVTRRRGAGAGRLCRAAPPAAP